MAETLVFEIGGTLVTEQTCKRSCSNSSLDLRGFLEYG